MDVPDMHLSAGKPLELMAAIYDFDLKGDPGVIIDQASRRAPDGATTEDIVGFIAQKMAELAMTDETWTTRGVLHCVREDIHDALSDETPKAAGSVGTEWTDSLDLSNWKSPDDDFTDTDTTGDDR